MINLPYEESEAYQRRVRLAKAQLEDRHPITRSASASSLLSWARQKMNGVQLDSLINLGNDAAADVYAEWVNSRLSHAVEASNVGDFVLTGLIEQNISSTDVEPITHVFYALEDGRIIQFELNPAFERQVRDARHWYFRVWIGEEYQDIHLREAGDICYLFDPTDEEGLIRLRELISDLSDQSVEFLEFSRDVLTGLQKDGAALNSTITSGMNSSLDSVREIASALSASEPSQRFAAVASYITSALSQNSENLASAYDEDEDAGEFSPSSYKATTINSCIQGAWTIMSSAATAIGTMLMVAGGAVLKTIGFVASTVGAIASTVINKIDSTTYATVDSDSPNLFYANAIEFTLPRPAGYLYRDGLKTVAAYSPNGAYMGTITVNEVQGLLYPLAANASCPINTLYELDAFSHGVQCGPFRVQPEHGVSHGLEWSLTDSSARDSVEYLSDIRSLTELANINWCLVDDVDDVDALQRETIAGNLFFLLYKVCAAELTITLKRPVGPYPDVEGWSLYSVGVTSVDMLRSILMGTFDYWPSSVTKTTYSTLFGGIETVLSQVTDDNDIRTGVEYALGSIAPLILTRGLARPGYGITGPAYRLSWTELQTLMSAPVTFSGIENISAEVGLPNTEPWYRLVGELGIKIANAGSAGELARLIQLAKDNCSPAELVMALISCSLNAVRSAHLATAQSPVIYQERSTRFTFAEALEGVDGEWYAIPTEFSPNIDLYFPGDGSYTENPKVVDRPLLKPPKFTRASIIAGAMITAAVGVAVALTAVIVRKKIRDHQKVKAARREMEATKAYEELSELDPGTPEYKAASKNYVKKQRRFQKYASRVGYSSNSVGSYSSPGSVVDSLPDPPGASSDTPDFSGSIIPAVETGTADIRTLITG